MFNIHWFYVCNFCLVAFLHKTLPAIMPIPRRIGVLTAMEKEFQLLQNNFMDERVMVKCCGGKVNAALSCAELIGEFRPDVVVSVGSAGRYGQGGGWEVLS